MNVVTKPRLTLDAFLEWERQQEFAHEFDGRKIIPMNGGTASHYVIALNLARLLWPLIDQNTHGVIPAGVKVVNSGKVRYPDLIVAKSFKTKADIVPEPVIVVEVTSPTSISRDHFDKNMEYRASNTIQQYVIVDQDRVAAVSWLRSDDKWEGTLLTAESSLSFPCVEATIALADLYQGVELMATDDEPTSDPPPPS